MEGFPGFGLETGTAKLVQGDGAPSTRIDAGDGNGNEGSFADLLLAMTGIQLESTPAAPDSAADPAPNIEMPSDAESDHVKWTMTTTKQTGLIEAPPVGGETPVPELTAQPGATAQGAPAPAASEALPASPAGLRKASPTADIRPMAGGWLAIEMPLDESAADKASAVEAAQARPDTVADAAGPRVTPQKVTLQKMTPQAATPPPVTAPKVATQGPTLPTTVYGQAEPTQAAPEAVPMATLEQTGVTAHGATALKTPVWTDKPSDPGYKAAPEFAGVATAETELPSGTETADPGPIAVATDAVPVLTNTAEPAASGVVMEATDPVAQATYQESNIPIPETGAVVPSGDPAATTVTAEPLSDTETDILRQVRGRVMAQLADAAPAKSGRQELTLRLDPPELGRVDVRLEMRDGRLTVVFEATDDQAETALRKGADRLAEAIASRSGAKVTDVEIRVLREDRNDRNDRGQSRDENSGENRRQRQQKERDARRDGRGN